MKPVVFLPGLSYRSTMWDGVKKLLAPSMYTPYALDLPEYGSRYKDKQLSLQTYAHYVQDVVHEQNIRTPMILVGQSLGGLVALHYAHMYPHRVASLVLTSTPLPKHPHKLNVLYRAGLAVGTRYKKADYLVKKGVKFLSYQNIIKRTRFGYISTADFLKYNSLHAVCSCYRDIFTYDMSDLVRGVSVKTTLLYGTRDTVLHKFRAMDLYPLLKHAQVRAVDATHSVPIDTPHEVVRAIYDAD